MKKLIPVILILILLTACSPDRFTLNKHDDVVIYGLIMSGLETAEKPEKYTNALHLRANARVALATAYITQFQARFTVEIIKGSGLRFYIRTIADNFEAHPSIKFNYDTFGSNINEDERILANADSIKAIIREKKLITLSNNGDYITVTVDCDTVYNGKAVLPATEYVIIETIDGTEAFISGIEFAEIYGSNTIDK